MSLACFLYVFNKNMPIIIGRVTKNAIHDRDRVSLLIVLFLKWVSNIMCHRKLTAREFSKLLRRSVLAWQRKGLTYVPKVSARTT